MTDKARVTDVEGSARTLLEWAGARRWKGGGRKLAFVFVCFGFGTARFLVELYMAPRSSSLPLCRRSASLPPFLYGAFEVLLALAKLG